MNLRLFSFWDQCENDTLNLNTSPSSDALNFITLALYDDFDLIILPSYDGLNLIILPSHDDLHLIILPLYDDLNLIILPPCDDLHLIIPLSHKMRTTLKCFPHWEVFREYKIGVLNFFIQPLSSICTALKYPPDWSNSCECNNDVLYFAAPLSHDVCMTLKSLLVWNEICGGVDLVNEVFALALCSHDVYRFFLHWSRRCGVMCCEHNILKFPFEDFQVQNSTCYAVYYGYKCFELWNKSFVIFRPFVNWSSFFLYINKVLLCSQHSYYFLLYHLVPTVLEFNCLICPFSCNLSNNNGALAHWLDRCLLYILTFSNNCIVWTGIFMWKKKKERSKEKASIDKINQKKKII